MESVVIENNLDKECGALSGLFQQVITEMKNGAPNFEEFIGKAGKLHTSLRSTILVLGSFLDSFQKIADSASNTKGTTRDIGTCLTRIVIRHRALESRMKTFAGALMDCLVLPIQGKLDEWKKVALILEKEHSKGYKKNRSQIKKKYDQVVRLKKKLKKGGGTPDPSVQRLFEQCSKDLNSHFRSLEKSEKSAVRRVLLEDRNRYVTFVAFLKPVLEEELAMLAEINQVEEVLGRLCRSASLEESTDVVIEDFVNAKVTSFSGRGPEDNTSLYLPTPPSTPYMGSRNNSVSSLASDSSVSINFIGASPSRRSTQSEVDYSDFVVGSRPGSSLSTQDPKASPIRHPSSWSESPVPSTPRPHTISSSFNKRTPRSPLTGSTFRNGSSDSIPEEQNKGGDSHSPTSHLAQYNTFSTIKRSTHSPFPRSQPTSNPLTKRPPLPTQTSSLHRIPKSEAGVGLGRFMNKFSDSSPHYATPKSTFNMQLVPNFISNSQDMIIPHPVYVDCKKLENLKVSSPQLSQQKDPGFESSHPEDEGDLKTPIAEELSFNERQTVVPKEDGSGSSSDSFGSSSGYGSQYTIRFDDQTKEEAKPLSHSSPSHQLLTPKGASSSCSSPLYRSSNDVSSLKTNTVYESHGRFLSPSRGLSNNRKPPPPIRRSSIGGNSSPISEKGSVDDDPTPVGSIENLSPVLRASSSDRPPAFVRSTSLSQEDGPITAFEKDGSVRTFYSSKKSEQTKPPGGSLDECNYIQSPGLRANLEALNSFVSTSSKPPRPLGIPNSIKAEIESALEKLRAKDNNENGQS